MSRITPFIPPEAPPPDSNPAQESAATTMNADFLARLEKALFNPYIRRQSPPPRFLINGTPISRPGNIAVIEAQIKSGKTAFVGAAISAIFAEADADCLGWQSSNPKGWAVIHLDTEQSTDDHDSLNERIQARARLATYPLCLLSYCVTGFSTKELKEAVLLALKRGRSEFGGIHSLILDGIADFSSDVNDAKEANELVAWLQALALSEDCPIIVVLHLNPVTTTGAVAKSRGHLGSQLNRKAEHVLRITREGDVSTVISAPARRKPLPPECCPSFAWSDEHGRHVTVENVATTKADAKRDELAALAVECFTDDGGVGLTWEQLHKEIERVEGCPRGTARKRYAAMLKLGIIRKCNGNKYRLS